MSATAEQGLAFLVLILAGVLGMLAVTHNGLSLLAFLLIVAGVGLWLHGEARQHA